MGTAAAAEGTDSPVTEPAAGHIRIKINVFCVDDSNEAIPQPGVTVEVRRDLYSPYYGENDPLPEWSDGLVMFTGTSDASGVVNIDAPYTVVKDPNDNAYDTAYLGDSRDNNHVILQRKADDPGYPIRFTIEPAGNSGYELNNVSKTIRNWKEGTNVTQIDTVCDENVYYNDFAFTSGILDGNGQENVGAYVDSASETVMEKSGTAVGSTPTANPGFKFVGWYKNEACTEAVNAGWVTGNMLKPDKTKNYGTAESPAMGYEAATYYAKFDYAVADLTIKQDGGIADENQTFIYVVTGGDLPASGIKVAVKGNSSVTIKNLKIGSYTVTEDVSWSWRYSTTGSSQRIDLQSALNNEVSFTNNGSNFKWLSGNAYSVL